jgi:pyruvate ferredoxin oxidoreductase beta subunit
VEEGKYKLNYEFPKLKPVTDYMKLQGRFRHLSEDIIKKIQERVTAEYEALKEKTVEG